MAKEKATFIRVDDLLPQVTVEQAAAFYGTELPELKRVGDDVRGRCFLNCGRACETGDRALAIQADSAQKTWKCFQAGCGKGGNLVSLCDLLKPGENAGGKPRGERFKAIAADIAGMVAGVVRGADVPDPATVKKAPTATPAVNVPLARSDNERARALVDLDRKFVRDVAAMTPKASAYVRRRPFLQPEALARWRIGYLPRDAGEDKSGGTMRGRVVYPYLDEAGELLTWFGRDPEWEEKHPAWEAGGKTEKEPEKFHFVKGFQRGLELWGQHLVRAPEEAEALRRLGLVLVEGPNDVVRLAELDVPAVALCAATITREQAAKAARLAREHAGGIATVFLDCDNEGEAGMRQCLGYLAQLTPVRLAWTGKMFGGKFQGRKPQSLRPEEWEEVRAYLVEGKAEEWSLS